MRLPPLPFATERRAAGKSSGKLRWLWVAVQILLGLIALFYLCCLIVIVGLRVLNPPTTVVQMERGLQALLAHRKYQLTYVFVPMSRISPNLKYAVIAAEDGRFYVHHGFDWQELRKLLQKDLEDHKLGRGGSTITQQLVKNLFLGTERSILRKGIESTLVLPVELLLSKERILELYLNVIEWGPGIFGAQPAAEFWYHTDAAHLSREQCTRLAAIIPSPLHRTPAREVEYGAEIQQRMRQMGWLDTQKPETGLNDDGDGVRPRHRRE